MNSTAVRIVCGTVIMKWNMMALASATSLWICSFCVRYATIPASNKPRPPGAEGVAIAKEIIRSRATASETLTRELPRNVLNVKYIRATFSDQITADTKAILDSGYSPTCLCTDISKRRRRVPFGSSLTMRTIRVRKKMNIATATISAPKIESSRPLRTSWLQIARVRLPATKA
jgi:hypothetical protein